MENIYDNKFNGRKKNKKKLLIRKENYKRNHKLIIKNIIPNFFIFQF